MVVRNVFAAHGQLRYGEQDVEELQGRGLDGFVVVPHEHVGMDGRVSDEKSQVDGTNSVVHFDEPDQEWSVRIGALEEGLADGDGL